MLASYVASQAVCLLLHAKQATIPAPDQLRSACDYLQAPARFILEYRTTIARDGTPHLAPLRELLAGIDTQPGGFAILDAFVSEIRASNPITDPSRRPSESPLYVGGTTEYEIHAGRNRFFQRMVEAQPNMPIVLCTPEVTAQFYPRGNTLEFEDPSDHLDLRTMESMLSPLPLSSLAQTHWFSKPHAIAPISDDQTLLIIEGDGKTLTIKCSSEPPFLPLGCWLQESGEKAPRKSIACFMRYGETDGLLELRTVYAIRESANQVRVDEYALTNYTRILDDQEVVLRIPADAKLIDRTAGQKKPIDVEDVSDRWGALIGLR